MTSTDHARRSAKVTPIYVIAGFLGSGKTTLLKRVLAHVLDRGVKPAVLMNEFGEVDVDGTLLYDHRRSKDVALQSLLSGCLCCELSGELTEKVGYLVNETAGAPLFIETTGLAETGQVVAGVEQALKECTGKARLASVIVMIDAARFLTLGSLWSAAQDHLRCADTLVLNKLDEIDDRQANQVEQRIRSINPSARIARATQADVSIDWLLQESGVERLSPPKDEPVRDSTVGYRSGSFKILRPINLERFERWLTRYQRSVVRLKGYVRVEGRSGLQEVQWVLGRLSVTPYRGREPLQAAIVIIGRRVPWERVLDGLEHCLVKPARQARRWSRTKRRIP